jgi:hypothetical protein
MVHGGLSCISGLPSTSSGRSVTLASSRDGISSGGAVMNDSCDGTHPSTCHHNFIGHWDSHKFGKRGSDKQRRYGDNVG